MATRIASVNLLVMLVMDYQKLIAANCNLALNVVGQQSTTLVPFSPGLAVDSNTGSFSHTLEQKEPWLWVDLGDVFTIGKVTLHNRLDCCGERLRAVEVGVTSNHPGSPVRGTYPLCGTHPGTVGAVAHITCSQAVRGRYVIVQLALQNAILTLAELEVFQGTGDSVYSGGVLSQRLDGAAITTLYVRAKIECLAMCMEQEGCLSVNYAEEGGCCELNADPCSPQDQLSPAP